MNVFTGNNKSIIIIFLFCFVILMGLVCIYNYIVAILICFLLVFFWILLRKPVICSFLILFTLPLMHIGIAIENPFKSFPEFVGISAIPIIIALSISLLRISLSLQIIREIAELDSLINLLFLLFFGYALTALSWTGDIYHGVVQLSLLLLYFSLLKVFPLLITSKENIQRIMKSIPLLSVILIIQLLLSEKFRFNYNLEFFKGVSFIIAFHGDELRPGGFAMANAAANILAILLFFHIILIYQSRWIARIILSILTLFLLFGIFKTVSRAGIGSFIIGMSSLLFIVPELRDKIMRISVVYLTAFCGFMIITGGVVLKRIALMMAGKGEGVGGGFLGQRIDFWTIGFKNLISTWGVGSGAGGFPKVIDPIPGAHSLYFSVLFDYGVIGFLLFILLIGVIIYKVLAFLPNIADNKLRFAAYCLVGAVITTLVHGLVDLDYTYVMLWFVLSFMILIIKVAYHEEMRSSHLEQQV